MPNLKQVNLHLKEELNELESKYPGPTKVAETDFLSRLNQLKGNPYNLKITFPDFDGRREFLIKLNRLQKKLGHESKYQLIQSLIESRCTELGLEL